MRRTKSGLVSTPILSVYISVFIVPMNRFCYANEL